MSPLSCSPRVTVIVPALHGEPSLSRCATSVLTQLSYDDHLIVVVPQRDLKLEAYLATLHEPRCRVLTVDGAGSLRSHLAGAERAETEIVVMLDGRGEPMPGWIAATRTYFDDPSVGAVGGRVLEFEGVRTSNAFEPYLHASHVSWLGRPRDNFRRSPPARVVERVDFLSGCNAAYRTDLLRGLSLEHLPDLAAGHELILGQVVRAQGKQLVFDSEITFARYGEQSQTAEQVEHDLTAYGLGYSAACALVVGCRISVLGDVLLGSRTAPGLLLLPLALVKGPSSARRARSAITARYQGLLRGVRLRRLLREKRARSRRRLISR